jgi:hypothetical protein
LGVQFVHPIKVATEIEIPTGRIGKTTEKTNGGKTPNGRVVELVDTLDLKSSGQ